MESGAQDVPIMQKHVAKQFQRGRAGRDSLKTWLLWEATCLDRVTWGPVVVGVPALGATLDILMLSKTRVIEGEVFSCLSQMTM